MKWALMCRFSTLRSAINIPPMCRSMPRFRQLCDTQSQNRLQKHRFSGRSLIPVRQGYTKCSVVPVTESAIITDDVSIASAAEKTDLLYCSSQRAMSPCPGANMALSAAAAGSLRPIQCYSTARFRLIGTAKNQSLSLFVRRACGGGRGLSINRYRLNTSARGEINRKSF